MSWPRLTTLLLVTGFAPGVLSAQFTMVASAITGATALAGSDLWFTAIFQQRVAGNTTQAVGVDPNNAFTAAVVNNELTEPVVNNDVALPSALPLSSAFPPVTAPSDGDVSGGEPDVQVSGLGANAAPDPLAGVGASFSPGGGSAGQGTTVTPEPGTILLLATGLALVGLFSVLRNAA